MERKIDVLGLGWERIFQSGLGWERSFQSLDGTMIMRVWISISRILLKAARGPFSPLLGLLSPE